MISEVTNHVFNAMASVKRGLTGEQVDGLRV